MRHLLRAVIALALLTLPAVAPAAWSPVRTLDPRPRGESYSEAGTRIAIDARGDSVAAWVGSGNRIRAASGDRHGRFGATKTLGTGLRPTVALAPDGGAVILWSDHGALRLSVRSGPRRRFGGARLITPKHDRDGDDFPFVVARPDGRFVVVYENAYRTSAYHERLRTLDIVDGRATRPLPLGAGSLTRFAPVRANARGAVTACCLQTGTPQQPASRTLVRAAGSRRFETKLAPAGEINGVAASPDGEVALGATDVTRGGDAIDLGVPFAARAGAGDDAFGPALPAPMVRSDRAFGGDAAYDPQGRLYLFWQQKTRSTPFSTAAPLYAAIAHPGAAALGRRLELDLTEVTEPQLAVSDRGVVAAWRRSDGRWGVALFSGEAGRPSFGSVPSGGPTLYHDFVTNRQLAAAGSFAALAWEGRDGAIHASVKRL